MTMTAARFLVDSFGDLVAGVDAQPLQHADQRFAGEDVVVQLVAGAVQPDHQAVADQLVVADALDVGDVLDAHLGAPAAAMAGQAKRQTAAIRRILRKGDPETETRACAATLVPGSPCRFGGAVRRRTAGKTCRSAENAGCYRRFRHTISLQSLTFVGALLARRGQIAIRPRVPCPE